MFLITAGAYVDPSIEVDFGRLPPVFLPLGNRRLLRHQCNLARSLSIPIFVSLPSDFEIPAHDRCWMAESNVTEIRVPQGLRLGESILRVIRSTGVNPPSIRILHGDTLFRSLPQELDVVTVNAARTSHAWAGFDREAEGPSSIHPSMGTDLQRREVLSGYFAFGSSAILIDSLEAADGDFVAALQLYHRRAVLNATEGHEWLDLGDLVNYYRSRSRHTTPRAFNDVRVSDRLVRKSSQDSVKMQAEIAWFREVPSSIRLHCPTMLDPFEQGDQHGYHLEYLPLPTLSELAVFGELNAVAWMSMLEACRDFVDKCREHPQAGSVHADDHRTKTMLRLERWARGASASLDEPTRLNGRELPSLRIMVDRLAASLPDRIDCTLSHGDLCFSNVLYDSRADVVRVIDPRGLSLDGRPTIAGDPHYDVAKLHHSAVGLYDFIIAGEYDCHLDGPTRLRFHMHDRSRHAMLRTVFESVFPGASRSPAATLSALLFFAMLPLHDDCRTRQSALLANAMRLFVAVDDEG